MSKIEKVIEDLENDILFVQSETGRKVLEDALERFKKFHEELKDTKVRFEKFKENR